MTFHQIYDAHYKTVISIVRKRIDDNDAAKDVVQDIFLVVLKNLSKFSNIKNIGGYIYAITNSVIIDYYKKTNRIYETNADFLRTEYSHHSPEWCNNETVVDRLHKLMLELPEQHRKVLEFRLKGLGYNDISKKMNISSNTVNHLVTASYSILRQMFNAQML